MEQGDQIVTFRTYYDPMLAEIIKGKLEANGIACYLADGNINTIMPIYNQMTGGIKLRVFARDIENANLIIDEDNGVDTVNEPTAQAAVTCPYCNSGNTRYSQATERKVSIGVAIISLLMLTYPFYARKSWHCFNCGRDFK